MCLNETTFEFASQVAGTEFLSTFQTLDTPIFDYTKIDYNLQGLFVVPQRSAYLIIHEYCRTIGKPELAKRCVLDYIHLNHSQAYAISDEPYHFAGISHSIPVLLQVLFQKLVTHTNPFVQDHRSNNSKINMPIDLSTPDIRFENIEQLILESLPAERWQKLMSVKLCELAVLFCFCHEVAHLIRGHGNLCTIRNIRGIAEFKSREKQPRRVSKRLSQAWELQADRTAIAFLFGYVLNNEAYKTRMASLLKCDLKEHTDEQLLSRVIYAICFIYFLFSQNQNSVQSETDHPSAITRMTFAISEMAVLYQRKYPDRDQDSFLIRAENAATMAQGAWKRLGFEFGRYEDVAENIQLVSKRLARYDALASRFLNRYTWDQIA